jgi:predicted membrane channel-forming protein YqfA (hemolysin III family)
MIKKEIEIMNLKLSEPKVVTFWIAVALAVLGVLASQGIIAGLSEYAFWLVVAGFVLLALGNLVKDL